MQLEAMTEPPYGHKLSLLKRNGYALNERLYGEIGAVLGGMIKYNSFTSSTTAKPSQAMK